MMGTEHITFGLFHKKKRKELGLTLRKFCELNQLDHGNLSKIERGKLPPPKKSEILERYASYLRIEPGNDDWYEFFDLAHAETGSIPEDIMCEPELVNKLPVVFRTLRGDSLSDKKLDDLVRKIKQS